MRKRLLSVFMVLALIIAMAQAAFAVDGQAATITAYTSDGTAVAGTYTTIDAAVNAAGENGRVVISEGTLAVNGRQTISKAGVTVEGAGRDKTFLVTSDSFQNASATNLKALLTIAADDVTVKGMTIDGSAYGETITSSTDFVVIRFNEGTGIKLEDVYVTGSPKTLMQLGMSNTSVSVTATNLYCQGMPKQLSENATFPDIDLNNSSTLEVNGGAIHAFISDIGDDSCKLINCEPVYTLVYTRLIFFSDYLHSTFQHYANCYVESDAQQSPLYDTYVGAINDSRNQTVIGEMVDHAEDVALAGSDDASVVNFITLLTDAMDEASAEFANTLNGYITRLETALAAS